MKAQSVGLEKTALGEECAEYVVCQARCTEVDSKPQEQGGPATDSSSESGRAESERRGLWWGDNIWKGTVRPRTSIGGVST